MIKLLVIGSWLLVSLFVVLPVQAATLSLSPAAGTFNKNCNFTLDLVLDTQGEQTDGTDAYLIYDTSKFIANSITKGTIYTEYSGNNIDTEHQKVYISGLADANAPYNGKGTFASVSFSVKPTTPAGASQIKFDFDPNDKTKTSDSNVVLHSADTALDVLSAVVDGTYTVGTGTTCAAQGATGASASASIAPSATPMLPNGGSPNLTATLAIVGSILTILGILGLVIL